MEKTFKLYWSTGDPDVIHGYDIADAIRKAGYGDGAMGAIDYWEEVKDQPQDTTLVPIEEEDEEIEKLERDLWNQPTGAPPSNEIDLAVTPGEWYFDEYFGVITNQKDRIASEATVKDICKINVFNEHYKENGYLQAQSKNLYVGLRRAEKEIEFLLSEVKRLAPGSYRAYTTLRDIRTILNNCKPKP